MNKTVISKIALFLGYLLFACFSAIFTANSLSLNLMQGSNLWLIFAMVFVIALLAGWCLNNVIVQISAPTSKVAFILNILGFVLFWGISFTTNVHYFFVDKHGYDVVSKELNAAEDYILANTTKTNKIINDECETAKRSLISQVSNAVGEFEHEIRNTMDGHYGFGEECISILKSIERILNQDKDIYHDNENDYKIFDEKRDNGYKGVTDRSRIRVIQEEFEGYISSALKLKLSVIDAYYNAKKDDNDKLKDTFKNIQELKDNHLPIVLKDGSVTALFAYQAQQNARVITKMPQEFLATCENVDESTGKLKSYDVYPSNHMFDTFTVWGDIFHGRLPGYMKMIQWILTSLVIDIVAFLLFALFCKKN